MIIQSFGVNVKYFIKLQRKSGKIFSLCSKNNIIFGASSAAKRWMTRLLRYRFSLAKIFPNSCAICNSYTEFSKS